jgi:hypothetical protein
MAAAAEDSFLVYLSQASRIVRDAYPQAVFFEAANHNASLLGSPWQFVFGTRSSKPPYTVIIERLEQGFGELRLFDWPWGGDQVIALPIGLGLSEALQLCQDGGCGGDVAQITLRKPLYPGVEEPSYIFAMPNQRRRGWVGVNSRAVNCEEISDE